MKRLALALLLAGCASTQAPEAPQVADTGMIKGDVSEPRNRARLRTELASLYYQNGNHAVALEELGQAVASDPGFAPAHGVYGLVYMALKQNVLAQQSFERALALSPTDPDLNHNYGRFLCLTGREADAIRYFEQAIRNPLYPAPWRSHSAAGFCLARAGKLKEAEDYLQAALKLQPEEPTALMQLGQLRYNEGKFEEARGFIARLRKVVEPSPEALWLALRIERKLGERVAEASFATQLRRRFPGSPEYQQLQRGEYD